MERHHCKACGARSLVPMHVVTEVQEEYDHAALDNDYESQFYTCHVCGDNWLSVKEVEPSGMCHITFVHQMGTDPELKRVAKLQTPLVVEPEAVEEWTYFLDDQRIDEEVWHDKLRERRRILRATSTN